jgi:ribosomal protein S30
MTLGSLTEKGKIRSELPSLWQATKEKRVAVPIQQNPLKSFIFNRSMNGLLLANYG